MDNELASFLQLGALNIIIISFLIANFYVSKTVLVTLYVLAHLILKTTTVYRRRNWSTKFMKSTDYIPGSGQPGCKTKQSFSNPQIFNDCSRQSPISKYSHWLQDLEKGPVECRLPRTFVCGYKTRVSHM